MGGGPAQIQITADGAYILSSLHGDYYRCDYEQNETLLLHITTKENTRSSPPYFILLSLSLSFKLRVIVRPNGNDELIKSRSLRKCALQRGSENSHPNSNSCILYESRQALFFFPGKLLNLKCVQAPGFGSGDSNACVKAPAFHLNF